MEWFRTNPEGTAFIVYWICLAVFAIFEWVQPAFNAETRRQDRWPTNIGIALAGIGLMMIVPLSVVAVSQWAKSSGIGLLNLWDAPYWFAATATVLVRSLAGYFFHIIAHKVGAVWRVHRVHHCDTHIDVSTSLRSHPLELLYSLCVLSFFAITFGFDPWALALYELADNMTSAITHANLRLPEKIDRPLRWMLVTPNMHCLHHSAFQPETDSNYGQVFSFWDRLFGTYSGEPRGGYDAMQIGLSEIDFEHASDFVWQMKLPVLSSDLRSSTTVAPVEKSARSVQ